ncbi:MAG: trehalose-phosphatase [Chloroflexota bacterium]
MARRADPGTLAGHPLRTGADALDLAAPLLDGRPVLVASDFDGTLAHLSMDPWGARILPLARRALRDLAVIPGVHVALISGRTASDLAGRVRIGGATYVGNHGVERGHLPRRRRAETLRIEIARLPPHFSTLATALADAVQAGIGEPWMVVERKIPAVTFHYRGAPDVPAAAAQVLEIVDRVDTGREMVRFPGRRALELRPPGAPAKGEAMRALLDEHRPAVAFMLGDDRYDARAFEVLRAARAAGEIQGLALAVAAHADVLPDVAPHADLVLAGPKDTASFLSGLARRLARPA